VKDYKVLEEAIIEYLDKRKTWFHENLKTWKQESLIPRKYYFTKTWKPEI
jgi:hypothetical protein